MKLVFFSAQPYDKSFFTQFNQNKHELVFIDIPLSEQTAELAAGADAVCVFVNDKVTAGVIQKLATGKTKIIALRCAGFNNVDIEAAKAAGIRVCRVPAYSPEAVAEHAVAMLLTLNRKTHKAYNRVREQNFSLQGLLGFNLHGKTIGVIGTGNIGKAFCKIMLGFGCKVMAFDLIANKEMESDGVVYQPLMDVLKADIISLHCPLNEQTKHLINKDTIALMKPGVVLINTSRGGLINTHDTIKALKSGQISALGIDVYEQEEKLFFRNLSEDIIQDDEIQRLMSFPNVLITAHQAFFTQEAMEQIATTTLNNIQLLSENTKLNPQAALLA
ncbi:2-hydroxyacid dehydrogenase [Sediminibacterium sp.]|jgi:D-lactate dehydrogenase|uniref:2-hydroxyacid dehydrogenase n=1 Tax=Sediminibacterium sp. TaxID=1917865 RepID=UPI002722FBD4|nr:2-hydroxyacid dehydrogenase [Sediminibacterium sp.]MDO8998062.1 2-hydroxyacid dehydrogenase [Sediminibacterium sp.]MDP1973677.1 2-hydroxyacid dehydrogenase [Sediminibacterium sp.]MDP2422635.1 2-hydroxyacid dehydrogenase [Sediminibacterium sp.]